MEFGKKSKEKLDTSHEDLQKIMTLAISKSKIDFGISEGFRTLERQNDLYEQGKSKIDGINKMGKHNVNPSEAVDIYIYHPDPDTRREIIYNTDHLSYIAGVVDASANELFDKGEIKHLIRWGANWDSDGVIALDHSFDDYPHFEIIKP